MTPLVMVLNIFTSRASGGALQLFGEQSVLLTNRVGTGRSGFGVNHRCR